MKKLFAFSLLELLVVLGLIAILALIALPRYNNFIISERRSEAKSTLLRLANAMEQYYFTASTYQNVTLGTLNFQEYIVNNHYRLKIQMASNNEFLISAEPIGAQEKQDRACGTLLLTAQRKKLVSGPAKANECWS